MLVAVELGDPVDGPMRPKEKAGEQQSAARQHARAGGVSGGDWESDLRFGDGECERERKERGAHDERRPLCGHESSPIRKGEKDQQTIGILPDEPEGEQR